MKKKNRSYLITLTALVVGFLLIALVGCAPKVGENGSNETPPSDAPNASPETAGTPESGEQEDEFIFLSKRGYISKSGCPTIVGEVQNATNFSMENILITASFYCSTGRLIGAAEGSSATIPGSTEMEILAPGETSPFKMAISLEELSRLTNFDVNKVEKYQIAVSNYDTTDGKLYRSFEIYQDQGEFNSANGQYTVTGKVKNIGNETPEQVKVIGTFYDSETTIIEVLHTYLEEPLLPGDEAQFEITVLDEAISKRIESFNIQALENEKHT